MLQANICWYIHHFCHLQIDSGPAYCFTEIICTHLNFDCIIYSLSYERYNKKVYWVVSIQWLFCGGFFLCHKFFVCIGCKICRLWTCMHTNMFMMAIFTSFILFFSHGCSFSLQISKSAHKTCYIKTVSNQKYLTVHWSIILEKNWCTGNVQTH